MGTVPGTVRGAVRNAVLDPVSHANLVANSTAFWLVVRATVTRKLTCGWIDRTFSEATWKVCCRTSRGSTCRPVSAVVCEVTSAATCAASEEAQCELPGTSYQ